MSGPPSADHHLSRLVFYFKLAHLRMGIPRCSMAFFFNTRRDRRDSADERRPTALPRCLVVLAPPSELLKHDTSALRFTEGLPTADDKI